MAKSSRVILIFLEHEEIKNLWYLCLETLLTQVMAATHDIYWDFKDSVDILPICFPLSPKPIKRQI